MRLTVLLISLFLIPNIHAADPIKPIPRRIPPKGIAIREVDRARIQSRLDDVIKAFNHLRTQPIASRKQTHLIKQHAADVDIYLKAVRFALLHGEFYAKGDVDKAIRTLDAAEQRIRALQKSQHTWTTQRGNVVRGYYSDIDGSPQPYGLEIPEKLDLSKKVPLYVWLHGRGDKVTDMHFIAQRETKSCPISPHVDDGIIVHPFGRHCVGYKGPGEIDVLDVIESVKQRYNIDEDRVALLGFSMGGAGAWHIGAHYADQFCVVHAGAGFAETKEYIKLKKENYPPWYEQKLWGLYDVPHYTRNLFNTTVIAYSGENDKQIQAARVMERAFQKEGRTLQHIIGPGMGHKYHPESLKQIMKVVKAAMKKGRNRWPKEVHLQTRSMWYTKMHWLNITRIDEQWADTRIDAKRQDNTIVVTTHNVVGFRFDLTHDLSDIQRVVIDDVHVAVSIPNQPTVFIKDEQTGWRVSKVEDYAKVTKADYFPGPIDGVVMKPFLVVEPNARSANPAMRRWMMFEFNHFVDRWRALYRGDVRRKLEAMVTKDDLRKYNLVLWGVPETNTFIEKLAKDLPRPMSWRARELVGKNKTFDGSSHLFMMVRPSPTTSGHLWAVNAGITHREAHDRTNSLQNPKLPDWAIISLEKDPDAESPGVVKAAGFFDEQWRVKKNEPDVHER